MDLFGSGTQIGVSIGSNSIKIAELKKAGKGYSLVHFGIAQLPEDAVQNSEIVNHMAVVDTLRGLVTQLKLKGKSIISGLYGASVIVKKITIAQTPAREMNDAIRWEAEQYVPFDIEEIAYDYQVLNKKTADDKMEVLLVASKRTVVEAYRAVFKDAGLSLGVMDVDLFALQNAFEANYPTTSSVALIDIGASGLKLGVFVGGQLMFSRDAAVGGRALTAEIQKHLNLSYQEAELLKIDGGAGGQLPQEVADLMNVMAENLSAEVRRSLDFYAASPNAAPVTHLLLAGGSAGLPTLLKSLENQIGLPTQVLNPFNNIKFNSGTFNEDYIHAISSVAAIPIGLALRGFAG